MVVGVIVQDDNIIPKYQRYAISGQLPPQLQPFIVERCGRTAFKRAPMSTPLHRARTARMARYARGLRFLSQLCVSTRLHTPVAVLYGGRSPFGLELSHLRQKRTHGGCWRSGSARRDCSRRNCARRDCASRDVARRDGAGSWGSSQCVATSANFQHVGVLGWCVPPQCFSVVFFLFCSFQLGFSDYFVAVGPISTRFDLSV